MVIPLFDTTSSFFFKTLNRLCAYNAYKISKLRIKVITLILMGVALMAAPGYAFTSIPAIDYGVSPVIGFFGESEASCPVFGFIASFDTGSDFWLGAYYGILLVAILYSMVAAVYYRRIVFVYYLCYALALLSLAVVNDAVFDDESFISLYIYPVILYGVICFFLLFAKKILDIGQSFPLVNKLINLYFVVRAAILACLLLFADPRLSVYPDFFPFLLIFVVSILSYRQGFKPALVFMLSYLFPPVWIVSHLVGYNTLVPDMASALYISSITQVVILGMALAGKANKGDRSKELGAALTAEVEKRVKHRMKDLIAQKKHLEDRLKSQDTFILKVTHDLKGPLRSIVGLVKSAKIDKTNDPDIYYDYIIKSSERLDTVISDLLTITRVTGKELNIEPVDFKAMILEIADSLKGNVDKSSFEIEINIPQQRVFESEPVLLYSIFQNIIENAMNYRNMESEEKSYLRISMEEREDSVRVYFRDNGIGIPQEFKNRIFEMFYRVDEKHNHKSTGLGLYMVRLALDRLDSSVEVTSEVGSGTCFTLTLKNFHMPVQVSDFPDSGFELA